MNDINWPDAGKRSGSWSLYELFSDYYAGNLDGVVNDRWGDTHWDFRTSEYEAGSEKEAEPGWENCRGIGFSFGYNRAEDERQILTGRQLACHLADVVSRGGRLLLNVGPTAEGEIPGHPASRPRRQPDRTVPTCPPATYNLTRVHDQRSCEGSGGRLG
jgi:alpha-L-fucosidase